MEEAGGLPSMGSHRVGHDWSDLANYSPFHGSLPWYPEGACVSQWSYEPWHAGPHKMHRSWQRILWSPEGNGKPPPQYTCRKNLMNCIKGPKDMTLKNESPRSEGVQCANGEEQRITNGPRMNKAAEPKWIWGSGVDGSREASLVAQMVKHLPAMQETWIQSLGWEDPLEKEMTTHSSILAWRIPWTEEPGRLQSMWLQRVRHNWATSLLSLLCSCAWWEK